MSENFTILNIDKPGLINARVFGKFRDVNLFEASDDVLFDLYKAKNPHVAITEKGCVTYGIKPLVSAPLKTIPQTKKLKTR